MNKTAFLTELKQALSALSEAERADVLRDMEEYFYEASQRGLTDEAIIAKLGSPKKIAEPIIAEAKVKRIESATSFPGKMTAVFGALLAILVLTPFNFIFLFFPLLFVSLLLVCAWPIAILCVLSLPIALIAAVFMMFHVGFKLFAFFALLFLLIGWGGLTAMIVLGLVFLTVLFFQGVAKLCRWNINFIKNQMRG